MHNASEGLTSDSLGKTMQVLLNNFTLSVLGGNPWVAIKQLASGIVSASAFGSIADNTLTKEGGKYFKTAMQVSGSSISKFSLNPKDFRLGKLNMNHPQMIKALKYSPMFRHRVKGYLSRELGEFTTSRYGKYGTPKKVDFGKYTKGILGKADLNKWMELITIMDASMLTGIHQQAEDELAHLKPSLTGEERGKAVAKRFEEIIEDTQPTFDMVNRTNFGRTQNWALRMFTMFSSQRAKNINILIDKFNAVALDPNEENKQKLMAAVLSVAVLNTGIITSVYVMKNLLYGNYGDDDDEFVSNLTSDIFYGSINTGLGNFYGSAFVTAILNTIQDKPFG